MEKRQAVTPRNTPIAFITKREIKDSNTVLVISGKQRNKGLLPKQQLVVLTSKSVSVFSSRNHPNHARTENFKTKMEKQVKRRRVNTEDWDVGKTGERYVVKQAPGHGPA